MSAHGGRPLLGTIPLSNAQRQSRYRANHPNYREKATKFMQNWRKKRLNASTQEVS